MAVCLFLTFTSRLCVAMGQPLLAASTMLIYLRYINKSPATGSQPTV